MIQGIARLFNRVSSSKLETLIRQVVDASVHPVCQRVRKQIETMTLSEARGYIRARAARVVQRESRLALSRVPAADTAWTKRVEHTATERLVTVVLREMNVGVPQSTTRSMAA